MVIDQKKENEKSDNYDIKDQKILLKFEINPTCSSRDMSENISSKIEKYV